MSEQSIPIPKQSILDALQSDKQIDKVQALIKLLEIYELDITIAGDKHKVLNLELITEYPNVNYSKTMVKNETWRKSVMQVMMLDDINDEKVVGTMDTQFQLKMISHRRKRAHEIINGLRNEIAGTQVTIDNTRRRKFLGLI